MLVGVTLVSNGFDLGYPFMACVNNLLECCDKVRVAADVNSNDDTNEVLDMLFREKKNKGRLDICFTIWDMSITRGKMLADKVNECIYPNDWVLYVQADEIVNPQEINTLKETYPQQTVMMDRLYFWRGLNHINKSWTQPLIRMGTDLEVIDDGMNCKPKHSPIYTNEAYIYHYSRVGDTKQIAKRLNNLDTLFHTPDEYTPLKDYEFGKNNNFEDGADTSVIEEYNGNHPPGIKEFYGF